MSSRVEAREDNEDLQVWLDGDHMLDDAQDGGEDTTAAAIDPCWRSNMLIQIILKAGQASPTHTFVYLDRWEWRPRCPKNVAGLFGKSIQVDDKSKKAEGSAPAVFTWFLVPKRSTVNPIFLAPRDELELDIRQARVVSTFRGNC